MVVSGEWDRDLHDTKLPGTGAFSVWNETRAKVPYLLALRFLVAGF